MDRTAQPRIAAGASRVPRTLAIGALWLGLATAAAAAPPASCAQGLGAAQAATVRACQALPACQQVLQVFDTCEPWREFVARLAKAGPGLDEQALRRALVDSGVPALGLPSCLYAFNRALCRQFLGLESIATGR